MPNNNKKKPSNAATILDCTVSPTAINHDFEKVFFPEIQEISEADDIDPAFWQSLCSLDDDQESLLPLAPIPLNTRDLPLDNEQENLPLLTRIPLKDNDLLDLLMIDSPVILPKVTVTDLDDLDFRAFLKIKFAHELAYLRQPVASIDDGLSSQNESQGPAKRHKITKDLDLGSTLINHLW